MGSDESKPETVTTTTARASPPRETARDDATDAANATETMNPAAMNPAAMTTTTETTTRTTSEHRTKRDGGVVNVEFRPFGAPLAYLVACEKTGVTCARRAGQDGAGARRGETGREIARDRGAGDVGDDGGVLRGDVSDGTRGGGERRGVGVD